jgi:predicted glycosyl hydrolase (DUF1957 family)
MRRENAAELDMGVLPSGLYLLELRYKTGIERVKVVRN